MENKKLNFYLPEFFYKFNLNSQFVLLQNNKPEVFRDGAVIAGVYGCFPTSIWNAGRCMSGYCSKENMMNTSKFYNDNGVAIRYTFTNQLIEEKHLQDTFCNLALEVNHNEMNDVIVYSELLEKYIRENYPKYGIISSTTKRILDEDALLEELEKGYKLVVIDYNYNNTDLLFESPIVDHAGDIELLVNAYCRDKCTIRCDHYKALSEQQINYLETTDFPMCSNVGEDFYTVMKNRKSFIKVEDLYGGYTDAGYRHFKIEGRTNNNFDVLESYIYYLIKPEYQNEVRLQVLKGLH